MWELCVGNLHLVFYGSFKAKKIKIKQFRPHPPPKTGENVGKCGKMWENVGKCGKMWGNWFKERTK